MPEYVSPSEFIFLDVFPDSGVKALRKERGRKYNFLEIDGYSLFATQFISTIRKQFKVELRLQGMLESLTVAGSAVAVAELQKIIKPSPGHVICSREVL